MKAILVSVDYADLLSLTLPYNRHHFDVVVVVTKAGDASIDVARQHDAVVYVTDAFTRHGAAFNKWLAIEECLDWCGRQGWLCLMDADIVWPKVVPAIEYQIGFLYGPRRRMMVNVEGGIPDESTWYQYPLHRNQVEWPGYTQIFHGSDPHLPSPWWHQTDWIHAGGADSFFQRLWPSDCKVRCGFDVLHLGESGVNWYGRATNYLDGSVPERAHEKRRMMRAMWMNRNKAKQAGVDMYGSERLPLRTECWIV